MTIMANTASAAADTTEYDDMLSATLADITAAEGDQFLEPGEIDIDLTRGSVAWYIAYKTHTE